MNTENKPTVAKPATIKQLLNSDSMKAQIAAALPQHMKAERMIRVATTAMLRTPKLEQCDQASFFKALLDLSAWGLEPDGRRAHLIPFENRQRGVLEVQLILDYKGLVELARRSGEVATIHADVICKNDEFEYGFGSEQKLIHKPNLMERGEVLGAYAHVRLKDGTEQFEVLSKGEIDAVRKRSKAWNNGPWVTDYNEMAKKTAFRRLSKWLPISAEMADAFEADDDRLERQEREISARERAPAEVPALLREEVRQPVPATQVNTQPETVERPVAKPASTAPAVDAQEAPQEKAPTMGELEKSPDLWEDEPPTTTGNPAPPQSSVMSQTIDAVAEDIRSPEDWRKAVIHFGEKTKGKTLGEIGMKGLGWFQQTWLPDAEKESPEKLTADDKALMAAVRASLQPAKR